MTDSISRRQLFKKLSIAGSVLAAVPGLAEVCGLTPPQTLGPFYPNKVKPDEQNDLTHIFGRASKALGNTIYVAGRVQDIDCRPISYAVVEIWQANVYGKYDHEQDPQSPQNDDPNFQYWGRAVTDAQGKYWFKTIRPGEYPGRTPHIHVKVLRRGYRDLVSQLYFEGEPRNASDGVYRSLSAAEQKLVTVRFENALEKEGFDPNSKIGTFNITLSVV